VCAILSLDAKVINYFIFLVSSSFFLYQVHFSCKFLGAPGCSHVTKTAPRAERQATKIIIIFIYKILDFYLFLIK
jgi:hypothetical protein